MIPALVMKRKNFRILLFYILAWSLAIAFFIFLRHELGNQEFSDLIEKNKAPHISIAKTIIYEILVIGISAGSIFAIIDLYIAKYFRSILSLGVFFILITLLNLSALSIITYLAIFSINELLQIQLSLKDFTTGHHVFIIYGFIVSFLVGFTREMDRKLGSGNLWKLFIGKFYKPRQLERIFMFIDLTSSTRIAEEIGNIKYSSLLRDCFKDLAVVANFSAEVYQYVGDEVVLNWNPNKGLKNNNAIHAFFAFQAYINSNKEYYLEQYGVVPVFKASAHIGQVTVTEVGELKSEICYHGDILNTTSRIQSLCSSFNCNLLISDRLKKRLEEDALLSHEALGSHNLKGKKEKVTIWKTELNHD